MTQTLIEQTQLILILTLHDDLRSVGSDVLSPTTTPRMWVELSAPVSHHACSHKATRTNKHAVDACHSLLKDCLAMYMAPNLHNLPGRTRFTLFAF